MTIEQRENKLFATIIVLVALIVALLIAYGYTAFVKSDNITFQPMMKVIGKIEVAKLFCTSECKWIFKINVSNSEALNGYNLPLPSPEQRIVAEINDSRANAFVDTIPILCTDDKIVCEYNVTNPDDSVVFFINQTFDEEGNLPQFLAVTQ